MFIWLDEGPSTRETFFCLPSLRSKTIIPFIMSPVMIWLSIVLTTWTNVPLTLLSCSYISNWSPYLRLKVYRATLLFIPRTRYLWFSLIVESDWMLPWIGIWWTRDRRHSFGSTLKMRSLPRDGITWSSRKAVPIRIRVDY
jgi:hypothetical protein